MHENVSQLYVTVLLELLSPKARTPHFLYLYVTLRYTATTAAVWKLKTCPSTAGNVNIFPLKSLHKVYRSAVYFSTTVHMYMRDEAWKKMVWEVCVSYKYAIRFEGETKYTWCIIFDLSFIIWKALASQSVLLTKVWTHCFLTHFWSHYFFRTRFE